jgi:MFS family permease
MNNITKLSIFTLLLLAMLSTMSNVAIITAVPSLKLHFSEVENIEFLSRMMITLPSLAIAILAPFLGHIIHNFGKKKSVILAVILFSFAGSSGLYLNSIEMLLASRALFGVAVALIMIVSTSLVGDYFSADKRAKYMSLQNAFAAFGGIVLVTGGGALADISWRYTFGIYLLGVLLIPLIITQVKEIKRENIPNIVESEKPTGNIVFIYLLAFIYMSIFFVMPTQVPFMIINKYGASGQFAGLVISTFLVSNALGGFVFAKLKENFEHKTIFLLGAFIFGAGFMGYGLIHNLNYFFLAAHIAGLGGGIMMTNITTWFLKFTTLKTRVKNAGYFTSSLFLGQFASPIIFFNIAKEMGVQEFLFTLGITLLSITFLLFLAITIVNKFNQTTDKFI